MIAQKPAQPSGAPQISILMTARNAELYLAEAIGSILAQETTRPWELLFVDDGSADRTLSIASRFADVLGPRMRVLQHSGGQNRGISASRNLALRHARGTLITFLDSDDVWLAHHLETQAALLDGHPEIAMVYAGAERWVVFSEPFDEAASRAASWGKNYLPPLVPRGQATGLLPRGELLKWFRDDESLVPCICTVMVRTKVARAVGGFCDDFRGLYDDQVFHAKTCMSYDVYANDICVARYRQHAHSCCAHARHQPKTAQTEENRLVKFLRSQSAGPRNDAVVL